MTNYTVENGKKWAIVSYITFVGLVIAIIMNMEKKNPFTSFHIRQMLGLVIMLSISQLLEKYINSWLGTMCWFITFGFWLYAFFHVLKGETKPVPYVGEKFQEWFRNIS